MITSIIGSTFAAAIYYELRQIKEGSAPKRSHRYSTEAPSPGDAV